MTVAKIDKNYESFYRGDILVDSSNYPRYGVKVLRDVYITGVGDMFIVQYGRVKNNGWVGDKRYNGEADIAIVQLKDLRSNYAAKWSKDVDIFKSGDVLKDQNGNVYLVSEVDTVWSVENRTHASLNYWESEGKVFTPVKVNGTEGFSRYLKIQTSFSA